MATHDADAILAGRTWIEENLPLAQHIAGHLMQRIGWLPNARHRLHVLYMVHGVLQTEAARNDTRPFILAFKPYLRWMLRSAHTVAGADRGQIMRLLELWVERAIITEEEAEAMRLFVVSKELPG